MKILAISLGGTIAQKSVNGVMNVSETAAELWSHIDHDVDFIDVGKVKGGDLNFATIFKVRDAIVEESSQYDGFIVTSGTDSIEELAFALDLLLPSEKPVVLAGSMKPASMTGYDGIETLTQSVHAIQVLTDKKIGVTVLINNELHAARYVRKFDSQLFRPLKSISGPVGEYRSGKLWMFVETLPDLKMNVIDLERVSKKLIPIVKMTVDCDFNFINFDKIDGLIIEGMGTGSLSKGALEKLSKYRGVIPMILTTRCWSGLAYDDHTYTGSTQKYVDAGFEIKGYEFLSALQIRILLTFILQKNQTLDS